MSADLCVQQLCLSSQLSVVREEKRVSNFFSPVTLDDSIYHLYWVFRKLVSTVVSGFTAAYVMQWPSFFPDKPLEISNLPTFDGRAVLYPNARILRDYMSWRQVDCKMQHFSYHFNKKK